MGSGVKKGMWYKAIGRHHEEGRSSKGKRHSARRGRGSYGSFNTRV